MDEQKRQLNQRQAAETKKILANVGLWVMFAIDVIFVAYMALSGLNWWLGGILVALTAAELLLLVALLPSWLDLDYPDGVRLYAAIFILPPVCYGLLALICDLPTLWIYFGIRAALWAFSMLLVRALRLRKYFIIGLSVLLCLIPAAQIFVGGSFDGDFAFPSSRTVRYTLSEDGDSYSVEGAYAGLITKVVIPETYRGLPVKSVAAKAFQNNRNIKKVILPNSVEIIGAEAFAGCARLKEITLPASVLSLGRGAFKDCKRLTGVRLLGKRMVSLEYEPFSGSPVEEITVDRTLVNDYRKKYFYESFHSVINPAVEEDEIFIHTEAGNGDYIDTVILDKGASLSSWREVTRHNYTFAGWYDGADYSGKIIFPAAAKESMTLHARWLFTYRVYYAYSDVPENISKTAHFYNPAAGAVVSVETGDFRYDVAAEFTEETDSFAPMTAVSNQDYVLGGWYGSYGITGASKVTKIPFGTKSDVYLTAQWTGTIRFQYEGATVSGADSSVAVYREAIGMLPAPQRRGYDFKGWYTEPDGGGTRIGASHVYREGRELTLYADWEIVTYVVSMVAEPGTTQYSYFYTVEDSLAFKDPVHAYLRFAGWYDNAAFIGGSVSGLPVGEIGNRTYYAKWTDDITLNLGYDGLTDEITVVYGKAMNTLYTPQRNGYAFRGWRDSIGNPVNSSDLYRDQRTLTAMWELVTYRIDYDLGGGSVTGERNWYNYESAPYTLPEPVRVGYTFDGWYENADYLGEKVAVLPAHSWGDKTYYAKWVAKRYTVRFDYNGGNGDITDKTVTYDSPYGALPAPARTGYTFIGWFDGISLIDPDTVYRNASDTKLLAHWEANGYTLRFDYNGGSGPIAAKTVTYDAAVGTLPEAAREGYTFAGWFDGDTKAEITTVYRYAGDSALTARWTANQYTLSFVYGTGSGTTASKTVTYDSPYGALPVATAAEGYRFDGWYTAPAGGRKIASYDVYRTAGNSALYARYTPVTYTVTLHTAGDADRTLTYTIEDSYLIPLPSRADYRFDGWYKSPDYTDPMALLTSHVGNFELYGRWIPLPEEK